MFEIYHRLQFLLKPLNTSVFSSPTPSQIPTLSFRSFSNFYSKPRGIFLSLAAVCCQLKLDQEQIHNCRGG
jgi:hypothetical protein